MMLARAMAASGVAVMRLPTRASRVVTRCARGPAEAAAPTARPAVPSFPGTAAAAGASCEMRARRGHLVIAAAKLPPEIQLELLGGTRERLPLAPTRHSRRFSSPT